ncbi:Tim17/Tim22/Tim23/Pmp24 family-domain-containing protein [Fimicolochytrium jonesii]|uniref:Tim17/Tim22/Tim23/Pmp24 family-domain-containing protein n=1 Tax=Fimicolochytrium jonesii TaxID=1396493 RepID=UPI0022FE9F77|nr:Tim17/Tim22/Tim23/Pmp24 family-domain-containing protein [Fimicolochytrium jonesii]KAI8819218.1 Tim17/Tim22/Tim23/Pmp24 family-domain-containing protein [Fimicolochytrium jonesii]
MSSWFGFGGSAPAAPAPTSSSSASPVDTAPTTSFTSQPPSSPSSSQPTSAITVSDMLADLQSSPKHVDSLKQKLAPAVPQDDVEILYLSDNPFGLAHKPPTGTFGPLPMRTGYDKLLYGVGTAYVGGLVYGGVYGTLRGFRTAQVPTFKVRMNNVLNQTTRYGPWAANSMGIMTMGWALLDNAFEAMRGGQSDYYNHVAAAFTSGFLFKSTAGLRPAVFTGAILAGVVGAYGAWEHITEEGFTIPTLSRPARA